MDFNTQLVVGQDGKARIGSEELARLLDTTHRNVMHLTDKYLKELESWVPFDFTSRMGINGGVPIRTTSYTRAQVSFLLTRMNISDKVFAALKYMIDEFDRFEELKTTPIAIPDFPLVLTNSRVLAESLHIKHSSLVQDINNWPHWQRMNALGPLQQIRGNRKKGEKWHWLLTPSQVDYISQIVRNSEQKYVATLLRSRQEERFLPAPE